MNNNVICKVVLDFPDFMGDWPFWESSCWVAKNETVLVQHEGHLAQRQPAGGARTNVSRPVASLSFSRPRWW